MTDSQAILTDSQAMSGALAAGSVALIGALVCAATVLRHGEGEEAARAIALLIRRGAGAFLRREYLVLAAFTVPMAGLLAVAVEGGLLGDAERPGAVTWGAVGVSGWSVAGAYLLGAVGSAVAGATGMWIATRASVRTTEAARRSTGRALSVALRGGAVMGLTVAGVGLLGVAALWLASGSPTIVTAFAFGASSMALFARVGGGIFTKAADMAADTAGKVEAAIPEDDPRNAAVVADNVGDMVGDVAGMGADLYESLVGAIVATVTLAALGVVGAAIAGSAMQPGLIALPFAVAAGGIVGALVGFALVRADPDAGLPRLLRALRVGTFASASVTLAVAGLVIALLGLPSGLFWVLVVGVVVGLALGGSTEFFTAYAYRPTRWIAAQSDAGAGAVVIAGVAVGMLSTGVPALLVVGGVVLANELAGLYGVALAAVGMLATVAFTLATDAFGSISDNAGGLAEQAHLGSDVRRRTDALDALGNTTAATGKGFAIGSAVLTALALMVVYTEIVRVDVLHLTEPRILGGLVLGAMLPFLFSSVILRAVGAAARLLVAEVRRQFQEIPGLREGVPGAQCDPSRAVDIATRASLRSMVVPGLLAVLVPIATGVVLGPEALGGLLIGSIVSGFLLATFMVNAGGAWDNAKKFIESGHHGGPGSASHAAAVVGDVVGDPFKDSAGPAINILIKVMSIVAVLIAPLLARQAG